MERWRISLARIMTHQSALRSRKLLRATFLATFRLLLLLRLRGSFAFASWTHLEDRRARCTHWLQLDLSLQLEGLWRASWLVFLST